MNDKAPIPGVTLKALRQQRGWSLSEAALRTGVSKAMLGQIEREESSPTVATLWKIATGFNVPFSLFITPSAPESATAPSDALTERQDGAMRASPLFPFDAALRFDLLSVELAAGARSESSAHEAGVIEHVIVIKGELMLRVNERWHVLKAEEGLRFQADRPHSYRNDGDSSVRFYSLIHYAHPDAP